MTHKKIPAKSGAFESICWHVGRLVLATTTHPALVAGIFLACPAHMHAV